MAKVAVITDSACDLPEDLVASANITVVPLTIRFGDDSYLDGKEISIAQFWERCRSSAALPETSAPSPGAFREAYLAAKANGADGVVCITLSSKVSATYQSALAGADALDGEIPVNVLDSTTATMGQGLITLAAAQAAQAGADLETVTALASGLREKSHVIGVVDTLDHLQRGGRIGAAAALVGSMLSIKPVLEVRNGEVGKGTSQRTRGRSLDYLIKNVHEAGPLSRLSVVHAEASDVDVLLSGLADVPLQHPLVVSILGPVVGTHTGPGTIAVCYLEAD